MQNNDKNFIPDGWEVKKLGDIGIISSAGVDKKIIEGEKSVKLLNYMDVYKKIFLYKKDISQTVSAPDYKIEKCNVKKGDVFFTPSSETPNDIARSAVIMENIDNCVYSYHIVRLRPKLKINSIFLSLSLKTDNFYKQAQRVAEGSGQRYVISQDEFRNFSINIPIDISEQNAIAVVLSDWDNTLELLDKKIELKAQKKKYMMQTLLTGGVRLQGFTTSWHEVKLSDIGTISSGGVDKKIIEGEQSVELLNYMDVYKKDFLYKKDISQTVSAPDYKIEKCDLKKGDIFFTPSSETPNDIAKSAVIMEDIDNGVYSYHIVRLRPKSNINPIFISFILKIDDFYKQAQKVAMGSGQRYVISQDAFRNFLINIPADITEQNVIAEVLTAADDEINFLKQKRALVAQQKKYLMQTLLTGQIRIPIKKDN